MRVNANKYFLLSWSGENHGILLKVFLRRAHGYLLPSGMVYKSDDFSSLLEIFISYSAGDRVNQNLS